MHRLPLFSPLTVPVMHKPLHRCEACLIRRLRSVAKLSVARIAEVTQRSTTSIYSILHGKNTFAKRRPKEKLTKKDVRRLVKVIRGMVPRARQHPRELASVLDCRLARRPECYQVGAAEPSSNKPAQNCGTTIRQL